MKKICLYDCLIIAIILVPTIPLSVKGSLGLLFIIYSSVRFGLKNSIFMTVILSLLELTYYLLDINVDFSSIITMALAPFLYFLCEVYLARSADALRSKNNELRKEVEKRVEIEDSLNEKIRLLQGLMDTLPTPIFVKDLDLKFINCNHAYERDYGVNESEIIGKQLSDIVDNKFSVTHESMDLELLNNKVPRVVYETLEQYADGSLRSSMNIKTLLTDEGGNPKGIIGVLMDITDRKVSEQLKQSISEDKHMIDELLKYDRIKTEFFSNISHELRTPLNVILGAVQLLEMYSQKDQYVVSQGKLIKNVTSIKQNCLRLLRLLNNLIDITKIDAQAFEIYLKNKNIVSIVEEITLSILDYANNKGITLEFDTEMEEKIIACDEEKIERIMLNLLSNAIKFTPNGGKICVNVYNRGNEVCIMVKDTGIGIPRDRQNEIFERFSQVNSMFTKFHEGSGIGLSLVKDLVKMHDGMITVKSELGKGTAFYVSLPNKLVRESDIQKQSAFERQVGLEGIQLEFSDIYAEFKRPYIVAI